MTPSATVTSVHVDDAGVRATGAQEVVLDVLFDGRRIWSFHLHRDGERQGGDTYLAAWPPALRRFLDGVTRLSVVEHVDQHVVYDEEVRLGTGTERIAVVNERGLPLGIDKSLRLAQTFDTRSAEHVAPLLDSIEEVLGALKKAGIDAFPAYGTLLGAVRGGKLIGHDSDADLGYVSEHTHPVDVVRESFHIQRALADMGYPITRYSGAAFKVDVTEGDGSVRGLDVFGGFLMNDHLYLMGEIGTPFEREWIFPLGTTTLEGRELPAPANTDEFLTATYGPSWRVPDPAYVFETPESTHRRLNGWFRGTRVNREKWDRTYSGPGSRDVPLGALRLRRVGAPAGEGPAAVRGRHRLGPGGGRPVAGRARFAGGRARLRGPGEPGGREGRRRAGPAGRVPAPEPVRAALGARRVRPARPRGRPEDGHGAPRRGEHRPGRAVPPVAGLPDAARRGRPALPGAPGAARRGRLRPPQPPARPPGAPGERRDRGAGWTRGEEGQARRPVGSSYLSNGGHMGSMKQRLRARGKGAARRVAALTAGSQVEELRARVAVLEQEVQECRQLNLRLAELTDVVGELLLPVAQRDEARVAEVMERYSKGL